MYVTPCVIEMKALTSAAVNGLPSTESVALIVALNVIVTKGTYGE